MPMKIVVFAVLSLLVALFALQNAAPVAVRFMGFSFPEIPLAAIIIGLFAAGILVGVVFSLPKLLFYRGRARELERQIKSTATVANTPVEKEENK